MISNNGPECGLIKLARHDDVRGTLCVAEILSDIPFAVGRVFWITDVPEGEERGGHAHRTCHEAVFAVSGGFDIDVDDGQEKRTFRMRRADEGIVIPAGVWCRLHDFYRALPVWCWLPERTMRQDTSTITKVLKGRWDADSTLQP